LRRTRPDVPVMISGTITDRSGRLLSGQTPGAFWNSVKHASPSPSGSIARSVRVRCARISRNWAGWPTPLCAPPERRPAERVRLL
jgi:hypothetical protein